MSLLATKNRIKSKSRSKCTNRRARTVVSDSAFIPKTPTHSSSQQLSAFYSAGPAVGLASPVQAKFTIGQANDPYEREADSVADRITSGQKAPPISPIPSGGLSGVAQRQPVEEEEEEAVQTRLVQRQPEEEEEPIQARLIQRQETEEEEEAVQAKYVQRQEAEEEENVQTKFAQCQGIDGEQEELEQQNKLLQTSNCAGCSNNQNDSEESQQVQRVEEESSEPDETGFQAQQHPSSSMTGSAPQTGSISSAMDNVGSGEPLKPHILSAMESSTGHDFSGVRVHSDNASHDANRSLKAKAFTHGSDVWLGRGQSQNNTHLIAHELTHVAQQKSAPMKQPGISRKPLSDETFHPIVQKSDTNSVSDDGTDEGKHAKNTAPGIMELKGQPKFTPDTAVADWLDKQPRQTGLINVRFGGFANGPIKVTKRREGYRVRREFIPVNKGHEIFDRASEFEPGLTPGIIVNTNNKGDALTGYIGLKASSKLPSPEQLASQFGSIPNAIGLQGFNLPKRFGIRNTLKDGQLAIGVSNLTLTLGRILNGKFGFEANDERITSYGGNLSVNIPKLSTVKMELQRTAEGKTKGQIDADVNLTKSITGTVLVVWEEGDLSGKGIVQYSGDKFSGKVTINLMEKDEADLLEQAKKTPEKAVTEKHPLKGKTKKKPDYVLFGEGELDFEFTEWLHGNAQVIIDRKGFLTVIGKITPKDFELFPQKDYVKKLFKLEARASYGIPVVGNIFIFANIGADAFAKIGPGKFYKISIDGTYTNDPKKAEDFSIRGSFNISAAAGLRLRGEAGAGLEILAHDIKAGAGINGIAGIRGYAEATPVIGYKEKPVTEGEDKKGEFFIRGDLEIAAQPFLGLSGDLFVEIDAPWWSPVPDKKWTWPLGGKAWAIGGNFGLNASVDYVFGSGKAPAIELKPVEFDSDKFLTDLYADKVQPKSQKGDKQATWKEKNTKGAGPPPKDGKTGNAQLGKLPEPPPAKSRVQPGGPKKTVKPADPSARTADGKSVKEYQEEAAKKKKKPDSKELKKGAVKEEAVEKDTAKKAHDDLLQEGLAALDAVTNRYAETGATIEEVKAGVGAVRRKFKVFKSITVIDGGKTWDYEYTASPAGKKKKGPKKSGDTAGKLYTGRRNDPIPLKWTKRWLIAYKPIWLAPENQTGGKPMPREDVKKKQGAKEFYPGKPNQNVFDKGTIGVTSDNQARPGLVVGPKQKPKRGRGVPNFKKLLYRHGFSRNSNDDAPTDMDHVIELQIGGEDNDKNLWPLNSKENQASGRLLTNSEVNYIDDNKKPVKRRFNRLENDKFWFELK